jgi:hypothetical protein
LPAPVRFLSGYDNVLLGHALRTRIVSDADRRQVMPGGAVDARAEVATEAERLMEFVAPDAPFGEISIDWM